jgi:predicted Zn-ribbon and HTH transcriptional regulator
MKCKCKRCGYQWESLYDDKPKVCPACKSYRWEMKRAKGKRTEKRGKAADAAER